MIVLTVEQLIFFSAISKINVIVFTVEQLKVSCSNLSVGGRVRSDLATDGHS